MEKSTKDLQEVYVTPEIEEVEIQTEAICGGGESGGQGGEDPWV